MTGHPFEGARNDPAFFDGFPLLRQAWVDSLVNGDTARPLDHRRPFTDAEFMDALDQASCATEFHAGLRALVERNAAPAPKRRNWWRRLRLLARRLTRSGTS